MTIGIKPEEAIKQLNELDILLQSYQLSRADDLMEQIQPYWKGLKAEDFKKKYAVIREQLSTNIEKAKVFCGQAIDTLDKIIRLDG